MALGSRVPWSPLVNPLADPTGEQDKLAGQSPIRGFNAGSNEAPTKALTHLEAPTPLFIYLSTKDFFTKFMKEFMETIQAQAQALAEPQERPFKARTSKTY